MKQKTVLTVLSALLLVAVLSGCSQAEMKMDTDQTQATASPVTAKPTATASSSSSQSSSLDVVNLSASVKNSDIDTSWNESDTKIVLNGSSATIVGQGASASGSIVTIAAKGTYVVSGTLDNGQIVIAATKDEKVHLVLNGASITNKTGAAIYASQCDKLIITLAEGTENSLTDGDSNYVYADTENEEPNAALFSKDDLTINGAGALTVTAGFNNGIGTKDDLLVVSGNITINAANHGLRGNDSVTVLDGHLDITSGNDGISSNNSDDMSLGYILIEGGEFTITAGGGYPGQSIKVNKKLMNGGMRGRIPVQATAAPTPAVTLDSQGGKGINASGEIAIVGGTFKISAYDDAIHSDLTITINGGTFSMESGAMGIQALEVTIDNASIDILNSFVGIEGEYTLTVKSGSLNIKASDDGISISNSAGNFYMSGGDIVINAGTDGIDCNGSISQSGGKVAITVPNLNGGGDGAIDYEGTFTRTGGTMVDANGNELSTAKMQMGGGAGGRGGQR